MANKEPDFEYLNYCLILFGVALSFSTLQDTKKTQKRFLRKIWENPKKGKIALGIMFSMAIIMIVSGLIMFFTANSSSLINVSLGITILGIGFLGLLKGSIEMFENHRMDKRPKENSDL